VLQTRAFIEEHLGDPDLTPPAVAAAHYVSVRYLHKLFETQEASVAEWIRQRRLERCRRDLLDSALSALPVNAIAARWGLLNAAHFSRAFRAAYGTAPGEYRRLAAQRTALARERTTRARTRRTSRRPGSAQERGAARPGT
jgi:AraC-like DNA-binding protein